MSNVLSRASAIERPIVRRAVEFAYFYFTGIDLAIAIAAVLGLIVNHLPLADATLRVFAQAAGAIAPPLLIGAGLIAGYRTGAVEGARHAPRQIIHTREHIAKIAEAAAMVRQQVQMNGKAEYYSNAYPAGTADIVKALNSHFGDLDLERWDVAARESLEIEKTIEERAKSLGRPIAAHYYTVTQVALQGWAPDLEWETQTDQTHRYLALKTWNLGRVTEIDDLDDEQVAQTKREWQSDVAEAATWPQGEQFREIRQGMQAQRSTLLDRLRGISSVDALPAGTRCDLCDPQGAAVATSALPPSTTTPHRRWPLIRRR